MKTEGRSGLTQDGGEAAGIALALVQSWNLVTKVRAVQADLMKPHVAKAGSRRDEREEGGRG